MSGRRRQRVRSLALEIGASLRAEVVGESRQIIAARLSAALGEESRDASSTGAR